MLGRILMKIRHLPHYRPDLVYARDILRHQILKSAPLSGTTDDRAEIHVLTSAHDWINTVWALKSFYAQVPYRFALVIHGDPSLTPDLQQALAQQFPDARIIGDEEARPAVLAALADYPRCLDIRENRVISKKIFDFPHYLQSDRLIMFDSDLLFFAPPQAFLDYFEEDAPRVNVFNPDVETAYSTSPEALAKQGVPILPEINSGFGLMHRDSLSLDLVEEFLGVPGVADGHRWRFEQTVQALLSTRFGAALLPEEYRVTLTGDVGDKPFRHYVGAVRNQMYTEGMRKLKKTLLAN